jgi:hypothetical protein
MIALIGSHFVWIYLLWICDYPLSWQRVSFSRKYSNVDINSLIDHRVHTPL